MMLAELLVNTQFSIDKKAALMPVKSTDAMVPIAARFPSKKHLFITSRNPTKSAQNSVFS